MLTFPVTRKKVLSHTGSLTFCLKNLIERSLKVPDGSMTRFINSYQKLLKKKYAGVTGLQSTLYCEDLKCKLEHSQKLVQVIHAGKCHWACISTIGCAKGAVSVMDSLYPTLPHRAVQQVAAILKHKGASFDLVYEDVDLQPNGEDCGLYSLAFATTSLFCQTTLPQWPDAKPPDKMPWKWSRWAFPCNKA